MAKHLHTKLVRLVVESVFKWAFMSNDRKISKNYLWT